MELRNYEAKNQGPFSTSCSNYLLVPLFLQQLSACFLILFSHYKWLLDIQQEHCPQQFLCFLFMRLVLRGITRTFFQCQNSYQRASLAQLESSAHFWVNQLLPVQSREPPSTLDLVVSHRPINSGQRCRGIGENDPSKENQIDLWTDKAIVNITSLLGGEHVRPLSHFTH